MINRDESEKVLKKVRAIDDEMTLFIFIYNYNWDNGFQIPNAVMQNKKCTLSVALMLFYNADGLNYLQDKRKKNELPEWSKFIEVLYKNILERKYKRGKVAYKIPLTKVQLFKLQKILSKEEEVFVNDLMGDEISS